MGSSLLRTLSVLRSARCLAGRGLGSAGALGGWWGKPGRALGGLAPAPGLAASGVRTPRPANRKGQRERAGQSLPPRGQRGVRASEDAACGPLGSDAHPPLVPALGAELLSPCKGPHEGALAPTPWVGRLRAEDAQLEAPAGRGRGRQWAEPAVGGAPTPGPHAPGLKPGLPPSQTGPSGHSLRPCPPRAAAWPVLCQAVAALPPAPPHAPVWSGFSETGQARSARTRAPWHLPVLVVQPHAHRPSLRIRRVQDTRRPLASEGFASADSECVFLLGRQELVPAHSGTPTRGPPPPLGRVLKRTG